MNKTTYRKFKAENKAVMKDRREKAKYRREHKMAHPDDPQPTHNRASRRQQLGIHRKPARGHKAAYGRRGAEHREVIDLHRELHEAKTVYSRQFRQAVKHLTKLGVGPSE